jgi:hypothetical protein
MGEIIDGSWKALSNKLEPLNARLRAQDFFYYGLRIEINPRYRVYYGQCLLFTEADPEKVLEGAQAFVRILEEGSKPIMPIRDEKDYQA